MGRMSEMSIDIRTARMQEQGETFGLGYGDDTPEPAPVKRCAWCCNILMGSEQRGRICNDCLSADAYDEDDDSVHYGDEYQPWEDAEWFTEGPGSVSDPRHTQGYGVSWVTQ